MKIEKSFNVQVWVGLRMGYSDILFDTGIVAEIIDAYTKEHNTCVTITDTEFRYVDGWEPGVIVGFIQYPRFPKKESQILEDAKNIAILLKKKLNQFRVSISTPYYTYLIGDEDCK